MYVWSDALVGDPHREEKGPERLNSEHFRISKWNLFQERLPSDSTTDPGDLLHVFGDEEKTPKDKETKKQARERTRSETERKEGSEKKKARRICKGDIITFDNRSTKLPFNLTSHGFTIRAVVKSSFKGRPTHIFAGVVGIQPPPPDEDPKYGLN